MATWNRRLMGHEVPEIEGVGSGPTPASRTLEDRLRDIGEGLDSAGHGLLDRDHGRLEALSMFPCSRRSLDSAGSTALDHGGGTSVPRRTSRADVKAMPKTAGNREQGNTLALSGP